MKYISIKFCLVIVALFGVVAGASDLPDCPSDTNVPNVRWHNCFGTYTFSSGSKYVGEFKDGNFNGQGTKTWANGTVEEGIWKNDKFQYANIVSVDSKSASNLPKCPSDTDAQWHNCFGTSTSPNGNKYVGEWKDDKRTGQGTFTFSWGGKYVGEFKDGNFNGQGTMTWADGTVEEGIWKNDKFQYANIVSVDSKSASNLPKCPSDTDAQWHNCFGTYTFSSGDKYVGEFKDSKPNGQGTYTWADGTKYVGEFKDSNYNGQGTITSPDGDKYVGGFKDNHLNGQGTKTWASGKKYVGEFKDSKPNGQGTMTWPTGDKYVGEWKDGNFNGQGTVTYADGTVEERIW